MNKQIEEWNDLAEIIYISGYGLFREECIGLAELIQEQGYSRQEDIAREIFAEIDMKVSPMLGLEDDKEYVAILATTFAELKKKYGVMEE